VDDHPLVREWLTNLIQQQPDLIVCGESEDAPEALEKISATGPDVAIVDISLKHGSGIELIKDLKRMHPAIAVIVLSMHDERLYAERALRAGARGYIMKRETAKKVIMAIRQVLAGKIYMSEDLAVMFAEKFVDGRLAASGSLVEQLSNRAGPLCAHQGKTQADQCRRAVARGGSLAGKLSDELRRSGIGHCPRHNLARAQWAESPASVSMGRVDSSIFSEIHLRPVPRGGDVRGPAAFRAGAR